MRFLKFIEFSFLARRAPVLCSQGKEKHGTPAALFFALYLIFSLDIAMVQILIVMR